MAKKALHIDWARFDGDSFQDMCNDLLVSENPAVVPLKSGPYKDQGRDAFLLKGKIGSISGDIVFQVKYHKPKTGNKNYTALKSDIKGSTSKIGEIAKSEKQKANHLIIMTNVSLNATQVDTLLGLAKGKSIKLHIWEERKIQSLLLKYPFIRFYYIKGPDYPMFVASRYFFGDMLRKRPESIVTHLTRLKGRSSQTRQFRNFLRSQSHILLIYAPPAQGKSRLILEFSRLTPRRTDWIPLFIRPEGKTLNDHLEELNPHSRYILLFEDIHLTYDRIREFTGLLQKTQNNPCIKIVFTARISFSGIIEESLVNAGIQPSAITEMRLPTLPEEDIFKILKDQLPRVIEPYLRDLLPFVKDSPLMAVAAAKLIQQGRQLNEMLQPGRLRNLLFEIPLRDLTKYCKQEGEDPEKHRKILILISALQPISLRDEVLISKMSKFLSIEDYELRAAIGQLLQFGFLKKYGQKVRLIPDTYGTIILENRCLTPQGDSVGLGEKIAIEFFDSSPERILDNMADIGQLSFPRNEIDIIRSAELFVNIKDKVLKADNFQRMDTIKKLGVIAVRRAPEVLDIIEAILANPRAKDDYFTHAHVLDEMTDVIYAIAMNIDYTHHALYLLKRLALDEEVALTHMNQKPDEAIRKIFRYEINKPLEYQKKAFETVTRWKDEDERSFVLAVHSISPIFRSTVSFTHSKGASFTFGNAPLAARTAVKQIRRKALSFLIEALRTGSVEVKFAAIETASNIGDMVSGLHYQRTPSKKSHPLLKRRSCN